MKRFRPLFFCIWLGGFSAATPLPLFGQDIGDLLRVTLVEGSVSGTVVSVDRNGFELNLSGNGTSFVRFGDVLKLERSLGTRSYWKEGLVYGAGVGVAAGILYGALTHEACEVVTLGTGDEFCDEFGLKTAMLAAAAWGGGLGLGGLIVGTLIRRQEWAAVRITMPDSAGQLDLRPWIDVSWRGNEKPMVFAGASFTF
ncbi:MAG: hypothetical protein OXO51_12655 [Gemmatimonadota bacterium]|nr:hypothetical protein [Gemmatimonadota bacterium]